MNLTDKERDALPTIVERLQAEERKFRDSLWANSPNGKHITPAEHIALDAAWKEHEKRQRSLEKKLRIELGV